jgi:NADPH:quinone reductase-like Zn-dependent oxidoreductase
MHALVVLGNKKTGIKEVADPIVGDGEVRVKLKAASINKRDYWICVGKYPDIQSGVILGSDGAGIVDLIGKDVSKTWLERAVIINPNIGWGMNPDVQGKDYKILGMPSNGTFAEYVIVNVDRLIVLPRILPLKRQRDYL